MTSPLGVPGVPLRMLLECVSHPVIAETITGDVYKGKLDNVDEYMCLSLSDVTHRNTKDEIRRLETAYIRSQILRCVILPYQMKNYPLLNRIEKMADSYRKKTTKKPGFTRRKKPKV